MPIFLRSFEVLVFMAIFSSGAWGSAIPKEEETKMLYGNWKLPSQLSIERVERLLNVFTRETHGKAFRYLGVEEDLFHGHLLLEKKEVDGTLYFFPKAILYHTQEEAHKAHWEKTIDSKYDYLDVTTRNWIQWLSDDPHADGVVIENAKKYLDVSQKDPIQFETEKAEPQQQWHYTIHAKNLDSSKLGFSLAAELQFEFYSDQASHNPNTDFYDSARGPISVTLPNGITEPLKLTTSTMLIERATTR